MRNFLFIIALIVANLVAQHATAQVDVSTNPFGLLTLKPNINAEFIVAPNFGVEASVAYDRKGIFPLLKDFKYAVMPISLAGKYYFNPKQGGDGFYVSVFAKHANRKFTAKVQDMGGDFKLQRTGVGVGLGYKVLAKNNITFEAGFGVGRSFRNNTTTIDDMETQDNLDSLLKWLPMATGKITVGYRFGGLGNGRS